MRNIPKEARLSVRLIGVYKDKPVYVKSGIVESDEPDEQNLVLRWANMQLLNHRLLNFCYIICSTKITLCVQIRSSHWSLCFLHVADAVQ